jgi:hypothetical protein
MRPAHLRVFYLLFSSVIITACADSSPSKQPPPRDLPTYTSQSPSQSGTNNEVDQRGGALTAGAGAPTAQTSDTTKGPVPVIPGGRVADVQEADVYKIQNGKLFLLNTYRGFLVYDISNTKKPVRLSHLPVYGYPVEMFVENNTVYALLSDSLYLTQINGQLQFQRRNTSQIVTIDISDPANPKLLQAQDLAGQLREGVSRKIENSIYVVSYQPSGYWYYGWGPQNGQQPNEQAWVYSFDASTPSNLKQVGQIKVFEGGSTSSYDQTTGESHSRYSNGVTLSATSNAIMVVQNWYTYDSVPGAPAYKSGDPDAGVSGYSCGSYKNDQQSVVSVVDVSDPAGAIHVAATFTTEGSVGDQFKQTYVYDAASNTGTYLGIFARSQWIENNCNYTQQTQNTLEAWNIVGDGTAKQLSSIDFGKPNETVRGSYFDVNRKVAFAITARSMDPMYAISFADRNNLAILSSIDGLSGDMDLFRSVENGQYLLAVGRDTGTACAGYVGGAGGGADAGTPSTWSSQISVSLIDVRDLSKIRLVQRKCLDIANSGWVSSNVTWNLDQAHKMIGLESDGTTNVLTVPVSYSVQDTSNTWYWYRYETAVGIMSWNLSQYQDTLPPEQQNVISTHGHFVHPNGQVNRSVIFTQGAASQREMLNISDNYLSLANIQNLDSPTLDSVVEVAAANQQVYRFGDYVVEEVALPTNDYSQTGYEFRVKKAGGDLDQTPVVAAFTVGQVQQVLRHGDLLVLFRAVQKSTTSDAGTAQPAYTSQALVYDLSTPTSPKAVGTVDLPPDLSPYYSFYRYYCGDMGYYGGYYFGYGQSTASVSEGLAFLIQSASYQPQTVQTADGGTATQYSYVYKQNLAFLDLRDPTSPSVSEIELSLPGSASGLAASANLVADTMAPSGFYISYRVQIGSTVDATTQATLYTYANYAQRWERRSGSWITEDAINIPGSLTRTWAAANGERLLLTRDDVYRTKQVDTYWQWVDDVSLNLLRVVVVGGKTGAERLDARTFSDVSPRSMVYDGDRIYLTISNSPYYYGYYATGGGRPVSSGVASGGTAKSGSDTSSGGGGAGVGNTDPAPDTSDHLAIIDMSQRLLTTTYDQPTELFNLDLMGVQQNKLFVNLQGDGILIVDVTGAAAPKGVSFYRTLGYASGIEFAGTSAYVPAYYYGTYHLDLNAPGNL